MEKRITAIRAQKNNPERFNIYLGGEFAFGVGRFVGRTLEVGQLLNEEQIQSILDADQREKAYQRALHFVGYKPRSAFEVQEKLRKVGYGEIIIQSVLFELKEKKYIDDEQFAMDWIQTRSASKPRSRKQLIYELRGKGIQDGIVDQAANHAPEDSELALKLGHKYMSRYRHLDDFEFRRKMFGVLARRAFSGDVIYLIIDQLIKEKNKNT